MIYVFIKAFYRTNHISRFFYNKAYTLLAQKNPEIYQMQVWVSPYLDGFRPM